MTDNETLPMFLQHRGHMYERTREEGGDLERAFANRWEHENERGLLQVLMTDRLTVPCYQYTRP